MRFIYRIEVEVERETGKFAGRDELETLIEDALNSANPDNLSCDNGGEYNITEWSVNAVTETGKLAK